MAETQPWEGAIMEGGRNPHRRQAERFWLHVLERVKASAEALATPNAGGLEVESELRRVPSPERAREAT